MEHKNKKENKYSETDNTPYGNWSLESCIERETLKLMGKSL